MDSKNTNWVGVVFALIIGLIIGYLASGSMKAQDQGAAALRTQTQISTVGTTSPTTMDTATGGSTGKYVDPNQEGGGGGSSHGTGWFGKTTAGTWNLPVCAVPTQSCPGIGSYLFIDLVGGGGGSGFGGAHENFAYGVPDGSGGGGGGGGNSGGYVDVRYTIPSGTTQLSGAVGDGGQYNYLAWCLSHPNDCAGRNGTESTISALINSVVKELAGAHGGHGGYSPYFNGTSWAATGGGGGSSYVGNTSNPNLPGRVSNGAVMISSSGNAGTGGAMGLICSGGAGGAGGVAPASSLGLAQAGKAGKGGNGGYNNGYALPYGPWCSSHGDDWGREEGQSGLVGAVRIHWVY